MAAHLVPEEVLDSLPEAVVTVDLDCRIAQWNKAAERVAGYERDEVLGLRCGEEILLHFDRLGGPLCCTDCPLRLAMAEGELHQTDLHVRHRHGHMTLVVARAAPVRDAAGRVLGAIGVLDDGPTIASCLTRIEELERLAMLDPLTGLANRRALEGAVNARLGEMHRYGWPVGAMLVDLDGLKGINDRYGHEAGDAALVLIARTLVGNARPFDVSGRWSGDEFLTAFTHVDEPQLRSIAERVRETVERARLSIGTCTAGVTISSGIAVAQPADTLDTLVHTADLLLYRSKAAGGNRVSGADGTGPRSG